ncbi:hypothetical protein [Bradyrhizobium sp. JR3.5]
MSGQMKPSWPWEWTGEEAAVPALEHDGKLAGEPVYRVRVRGTEDLELAYGIVQPDGSTDSFPVALRRAIGLVRLSGDDRNDRDLRLVRVLHWIGYSPTKAYAPAWRASWRKTTSRAS